MTARYVPVIPLEALTDAQITEMIQTYERFNNGSGMPKGLPTCQFYPIRDVLAELIHEAYRRGLVALISEMGDGMIAPTAQGVEITEVDA